MTDNEVTKAALITFVTLSIGLGITVIVLVVRLAETLTRNGVLESKLQELRYQIETMIHNGYGI